MKTLIPLSDFVLEQLNGKRVLNVSEYYCWGSTEYVIRLSGYLCINNNELKVLYGSEKTYSRFRHDQNEENPFKKLGGYALNKIDLNDLIFIEEFGCFVPKEYYYLIKNLNPSDIKHTVWIKKNKSESKFNYRIGYKQFELTLTPYALQQIGIE